MSLLFRSKEKTCTSKNAKTKRSNPSVLARFLLVGALMQGCGSAVAPIVTGAAINATSTAAGTYVGTSLAQGNGGQSTGSFAQLGRGDIRFKRPSGRFMECRAACVLFDGATYVAQTYSQYGSWDCKIINLDGSIIYDSMVQYLANPLILNANEAEVRFQRWNDCR